jgi:formylglycine-generating enzyme required for sulfatase activity
LPAAPPELRDPLKVGGFAPVLVRVPAGTVVLPRVDGQPGRTVAIQPFALAAQPVTFADYEFFARQTDRSLPYDGGLRPEERATHPVTAITWYEAQAYVEWLSQQTGQRYRLPSEAEWVYAGQAGVGERGGIAWEWMADCAGDGPNAMPLHQAARDEADGSDCGQRVRRGESGSGGEPQPADRGGRDIGFRVARELNPVDMPP